MALTGLCADGFGRRFGAKGFLVTELGQVAAVAAEVAEVARGGRPVLINCHIARSDFRAGSISV